MLYSQIDRATNTEIRRRDMPELRRADWLPVTVEPQPEYDAATQRLVRLPGRIEGGRVVDGWAVESLPAKTPEQIQAEFSMAIQARLDAFARERLYDNILSACTYVSSAVPQFAAEGQRCVELRDATWGAAYIILNDVLAGNRPVPTIETVFAKLPALAWPE